MEKMTSLRERINICRGRETELRAVIRRPQRGFHELMLTASAAATSAKTEVNIPLRALPPRRVTSVRQKQRSSVASVCCLVGGTDRGDVHRVWTQATPPAGI